ncbi:MAG: MCE family protein [Pseudomonadaceae bacterium]|nr:MCE family protein [Pseudomonadaceae bacterium]
MPFTHETKVGALVIAALGGLVWLSAQSGVVGTSLGTPASRHLSSTFNDVEGISVGSPVKMAGVPVGEVTAVELQPTGNAIIRYTVRKDVPVPADVTAQITTSGLIGERYLALVPGASTLSPEGQAILLPPPATSIPSAGGAGAGDVAGNFGKVGEDLQAMTGTLRTVLGDPENAQKIQQIIDGLASFANNVNAGSNGTFAKFDNLADTLNRLASRLESGDSTLGALLAKDNGQGKETLANLNAAMADLRGVMSKINNGEGTIGKLINDPQTADKIDSALDTLSQVGERVEQFRTEVDFQGYALTNESGIGKGGVQVTLQPRPTRFYVIGASADGFASTSRNPSDARGPYFGRDFGPETKYTAQFGHVFQDAIGGQDVAVRVGLKDNTGGVGLDTALPTGTAIGDIELSSDVYDFAGNNTPGSDVPHWDVKAKVNLWEKMLYAVTGYDNILSQDYGSPIIGLGLRFQDDDLKYILGKQL